MNLRPGELGAFAVTLVVAGAALVSGELAADYFVRDTVTAKRPPELRAKNIFPLPEPGQSLPPAPPEQKFMLLMGNSHTYALPGLEKGKPLLLDPGVTLVDRLEAEVFSRAGFTAGGTGAARPNVYRLSYPNFLPFEMLVRAGYLLTKKYEPAVVVFGLTYRNIARDSEPRAKVQDAFHDPDFGAALGTLLRAPDVNAGPDVLAAIERQVEEAHRIEREDRMRSSADRINEMLIDRVEEDVTLIGRSHQVRQLIYRSLTFDIQESFAAKQEDYLYDEVESDRVFNEQCVYALLSLFRARGASVLVYLAPERSDLPPLIDPKSQEAFNARLRTFADAHGIAVIDARRLVPNQYWGWMLDSPDRSHFSEKGHAMLAEFIAVEGEKLGAWKALEKR